MQRRRCAGAAPWGGRVRAVALASLALGACNSGSKSERIRRSNEQAPVVVVAPSASTSRPRSSIVEKEPNDGAAEGTPLALDVVGRGRLEGATDVDRFRITVAKAGVLTATVTGLTGVDLIVELRDGSDALLARSDRGGAKVSEGIGGYAVSAGSYDLVVRSFVKPAKPVKGKAKADKGKAKADKPQGKPDAAAGSSAAAGSAAVVVVTPSEEYEVLVAVAEPSSGQEVEPNFDVGTASDLTVGESVTGLIGWAGDVDVWKIGTEVLSSSDALDLELSAVDGVALTLELRDGMVRSQATRKGGRGLALAIHGWVPNKGIEGAPPFLYLLVSGDRSHPQLAYQLKLSARAAAPGEELEPNDRPDAAQVFEPDVALLHARWDTGDVDCFELPTAPGARRLEATVDAAAGTNLATELLVGDRVIATSDQPMGKVERLVGDVPGGARVVVRVRGAAKPGAEGRYDVSWSEAEGDAMPPEEGSPAPP